MYYQHSWLLIQLILSSIQSIKSFFSIIIIIIFVSEFLVCQTSRPNPPLKISAFQLLEHQFMSPGHHLVLLPIVLLTILPNQMQLLHTSITDTQVEMPLVNLIV